MERSGCRLLSEEVRRVIEAFARQHMGAEPGHDFEHAHRVRGWALRIAEAEDYDRLDLVEAAALLHDIGLSQPRARRRHGQTSAEMAATFLRTTGLFDEADVDCVLSAIRFHGTNRGGSGILLDILRDADMMEMFGPIGLLRSVTPVAHKPEYLPGNVKGETWQMTAGEFDERFDSGVGVGDTLVDHVNFHISCYDNLATATARNWAAPHVEFLKQFVLSLEQQLIERDDGQAGQS